LASAGRVGGRRLCSNSGVREFDAASYGDGMADVYDQWYADLEVDEPVAALAALAGTGPVLELGVGTGRLAIPLAVRGLAVQGVLTVTVTDVAAQTAHGQFVELVDGERVRLRPWAIRWCTPEQLDAMATTAGLQLEHRWGGWRGQPFTVNSSRHVSVWRQNPDLGWNET